MKSVFLVYVRTSGEVWHTAVCETHRAAVAVMKGHGIDMQVHAAGESVMSYEFEIWKSARDGWLHVFGTAVHNPSGGRDLRPPGERRNRHVRRDGLHADPAHRPERDEAHRWPRARDWRRTAIRRLRVIRGTVRSGRRNLRPDGRADGRVWRHLLSTKSRRIAERRLLGYARGEGTTPRSRPRL